MKNYWLYSTNHYKYGSPGVAATNCCVYVHKYIIARHIKPCNMVDKTQTK